MKQENQFIKVHVSEGNDTSININLPLALTKNCLRLLPRKLIRIIGNQILQQLENNNNGELINIKTIKKGKPTEVKVFIE